MDVQEALKEIGKYAPCPHDCVDTRLGDGSVWAKCYDCGEIIQQDSIELFKKSHDSFMLALQVIQDSLKQLKE